MMLKKWLDRKLYPGVKNRWDQKYFRNFILNELKSNDRLLDLGAGAGIIPEMNFKNNAQRIYGIDPDPMVKKNPFLHESYIGGGEKLPFTNEMFDVIICNSVLEHLEDPKSVFSEVKRVLKSGGLFFFRTPNKYHYMAFISQITSDSFHEWVNENRGRDTEDTYPTFYRANSRKDILALAKTADLSVGKLDHLEGRPEYLRFSAPTYILGWVYEKLVNSSLLFKPFRIVMIGMLKKKSRGK